MKRISMYFVVILVGIVMFGCKKDSSTAISKDDIVGSWKMTAMTVSPAIDGVTDMLSTWAECEKDDLTIFAADGTYTQDNGATKCDPLDPQTKNTGTYVISSDNKTLTMTTTEEVMSLTIVTLTSSKFVGTMNQVEGGNTYTVKVTLAKQ